MDGPAVAERSPAPPGGKQFPRKGVEHKAEAHPAAFGQRQRNCAVPEAVDQVGGAVHRVQDPDRKSVV